VSGPRVQSVQHTTAPVGNIDWPLLTRRVARRLRKHLIAHHQLSPRDTLKLVAPLLPPAARRTLVATLRARGWLDPDAIIPFDILDSPRCPPAFRTDLREIARLALFGPGGQGLAWRDKHRDGVFQQLCAEIMRGAVDLVSLQNIAARVMNHPDARADPTLAGWLRRFIAEREAALHTLRTPEDEHDASAHASKLKAGFDHDEAARTAEVRRRFTRLLREYDGLLAQFEERGALKVLDRMRELRRRYPNRVPTDTLQRCEEQYDRLLKRAGAYRRQIQSLAEQGAEAARTGNWETAGWVRRRLEAIHQLLPNLLPQRQLEQLRRQIEQSDQEHESAEAARELLENERAVAARIKRLAGIIHRYHKLVERLGPADPACQRAEENYRQAVDEIRGLDTEWLTGLVLHLETLIEDLDDPEGTVQNQLDQFIASVRSALNRVCLEIRAHRRKNSPRPDAPPAGNAPPAAPNN
jgi:hypothetical protein